MADPAEAAAERLRERLREAAREYQRHPLGAYRQRWVTGLSDPEHYDPEEPTMPTHQVPHAMLPGGGTIRPHTRVMIARRRSPRDVPDSRPEQERWERPDHGFVVGTQGTVRRIWRRVTQGVTVVDVESDAGLSQQVGLIDLAIMAHVQAPTPANGAANGDDAPPLSELEAYKARLVTVARRLADEHGWCSVVDDALRELDALPRRVEVTVVSRITVTLPPGQTEIDPTLLARRGAPEPGRFGVGTEAVASNFEVEEPTATEPDDPHGFEAAREGNTITYQYHRGDAPLPPAF